MNNLITGFGHRQKNAFVRVALYVPILMLAGLALTVLPLLIIKMSGHMPQNRDPSLATLAVATVYMIGFMTAAILSAHYWSKWLGENGLSFIGLNQEFRKFSVGIFYGSLLQILCFALLATLGWLTISSFQLSAASVINISILTVSSLNAGITEEIMFRGVVFSVFRKNDSSFVKAAAISSVVFSSMHFINNTYVNPLLAGAGLMISGVILAWLREESGSLWLPIGIHFSWDALIGWLNLSAASSPHFIMTTRSAPMWIVGDWGLFDFSFVLVVGLSILVFKKPWSQKASP